MFIYQCVRRFGKRSFNAQTQKFNHHASARTTLTAPKASRSAKHHLKLKAAHNRHPIEQRQLI